MEWGIKPLAKRCAATDKPFLDGDEVVCLVMKSAAGELVRHDVLAGEIENFSPDGTLLGQWRRVFASNSNSAAAAKQLTASREEFFISLFDAPATDEGDLLKQLFALLLERKRILRPLGSPENGEQLYLHVRSRREFAVPVKQFEPEDIASVEEFLSL